MSAAVCPSCGVAVVPGYVRCPKCQKALPRRTSPVVGGTALPERQRKLPVLAIIAAGFATLAIIVYLGLRGTSDELRPAPSAPAAQTETPAAEPTAAPEPPDVPAQPMGPSAIDVARDLERALKRQRLWSTVNVIGARADVRSGSCSDPAIAPHLDGAAPSFKAAGLTKLRCLEQSGRVVSERDL